MYAHVRMAGSAQEQTTADGDHGAKVSPPSVAAAREAQRRTEDTVLWLQCFWLSNAGRSIRGHSQFALRASPN